MFNIPFNFLSPSTAFVLSHMVFRTDDSEKERKTIFFFFKFVIRKIFNGSTAHE